MLEDLINWDSVMKQPRTAGGHKEIMENLFKDAEIIVSYIEDAIEGEIGYVYLIDNKLILTTDCFDSCDAYDECSDEELENLCIQIVNTSKIFDSMNTLITFLRNVKEDHAIDYDLRNLARPLISELYKNNQIEIDSVLNG